MSAFDEARSGVGRGTGRIARGAPRPTGAGSASGFDSIPGGSGAAASASYQNGDAAFTATRDGVERDLRKLTTLVATARKQVDQIGAKMDSPDLRARVDGNLSKGKDVIKAVGAQLKNDFEPFVRATDISRGEADQRRVQLQRFTKDYKAGVDAFTEVANAAVAAMKRHPVPTAAAAAATGAEAERNDARKAGKLEDQQKLWVRRAHRCCWLWRFASNAVTACVSSLRLFVCR